MERQVSPSVEMEEYQSIVKHLIIK